MNTHEEFHAAIRDVEREMDKADKISKELDSASMIINKIRNESENETRSCRQEVHELRAEYDKWRSRTDG